MVGYSIVFFSFSSSNRSFFDSYRNCPTVLSLMLCSYLMQFDFFDDHSPGELFRITFVSFSPMYLMLCLTALAIDICGKWLILGRREQGEYPWDQSSYCQRWQMYLTLQEIRRGERHKTGILDMIQGTPYLVWYFRALGAKIGNNVCLFPNGGDPMFTEPDLVTIGDFVGIDEASVIAHINTRGIFRLNPLNVGTGCVLKPMSRLLSGASMESHSILLEHTLVLAGENVTAGSVWQGEWPDDCSCFFLLFVLSSFRQVGPLAPSSGSRTIARRSIAFSTASPCTTARNTAPPRAQSPRSVACATAVARRCLPRRTTSTSRRASPSPTRLSALAPLGREATALASPTRSCRSPR